MKPPGNSLQIMNSKVKKTSGDRFLREFFLNCYLLIIPVLSIFLFLYGFFPVTRPDYEKSTFDNVPRSVDGSSIKIDEIYKPEVQKFILMVIDAWRWNFFLESTTNGAMPKVNSLIKDNRACIYKTRVNIPTVTMPRIKALTSGTIPNFVDVALNLGSTVVQTDNLLVQAQAVGHKIIFYGDETWIKLFPTSFHRSEGTTAFYVNDYTEVDSNVTRHLDTELSNQDWSIMILHYLGLDHIGHIFGPYSPLIRPKLQEMDDVISKIVSFQEKNKEKILFVVTGDHGMKDSGSHGGATSAETLVPMLSIGKTCSPPLDDSEEISQIDIVPTVATLLGLPIPYSSLGSLMDNLVKDFNLEKLIYCYFYNTKQVYGLFKKLFDTEVEEFQEAVGLHSAWIASNSSENGENIIKLYKSALKKMKSRISSRTLEYNIPVMSFSIVILSQILCVSLTKSSHASISFLKLVLVVILSALSVFLLNQAFSSYNEFSVVGKINFSMIPWGVIFVVNCFFLANRRVPISELKNCSVAELLCILGMILHAVSLTSSSFVEEEHQTWYFYWITLISLLTYDTAKKTILSKKKYISLRITVMLILLVFSHRILRKLNSTGDKYAHLPDLSDWLISDTSKVGMTAMVVSSLSGLILLDFFHPNNRSRILNMFFDLSSAICIYLRHVANYSVLRPEFLPTTTGHLEIKIFWLIQIAQILVALFRLYGDLRGRGRKRDDPVQQTLYLLVKEWVTISSLLHRPYNVVLLPIQLITGKVISTINKNYRRQNLEIYFIIWSSNVFYFYQGNSNSLATVDLAAGYVGLESYNPFLISVFLAINTYSAPILGLLMYFYSLKSQNPSISPLTKIENMRHYAACRLLPATFYVFIVSIQRYHLFIWSVFSPKLIYEAMHCLLLFAAILALESTFLLQDFIDKKLDKHFL